MFNWLLRPFRQPEKKERPQPVTQAHRNNIGPGGVKASPYPYPPDLSDIYNTPTPLSHIPVNAASDMRDAMQSIDRSHAMQSHHAHHNSDSGSTHNGSHDSGGSCGSGGGSSGGCSGD